LDQVKDLINRHAQGQRMKGCTPSFRKISLNGWDAAPL
jgi:hypothetical protein